MNRIDALKPGAGHELEGLEHPLPRPRPPTESSTVTPFAPVATTHRELRMNVQWQGNTNACGTTSLANVLSYWGRPTSHEVIDASIRHFNLFTAPDDIVAYARRQGLRAELKNGATVEDLAHLVDQGVPPIVIIEPGNSADLGLHYVTVTGYDRGPNGDITSITLADSALGTTRRLPVDQFKQQWGNLRLANVGTGLNNVMISIAPADGRPLVGADSIPRFANDINLPKSNEVGAARVVAIAVSQISSAVAAVGSFLRGLFG